MTTSHPADDQAAGSGSEGSRLRLATGPPRRKPGGTDGTPGSSRVLGVRSLALISVAAVLALRGMPSVAEYGWSSIVYYLLGALFFFVPLALVVAELGNWLA